MAEPFEFLTPAQVTSDRAVRIDKSITWLRVQISDQMRDWSPGHPIRVTTKGVWCDEVYGSLNPDLERAGWHLAVDASDGVTPVLVIQPQPEASKP